MKRACRQAAKDFDALASWAGQEGMSVRVNVLHCGSGKGGCS
jgi:hypothetical protein